MPRPEGSAKKRWGSLSVLLLLVVVTSVPPGLAQAPPQPADQQQSEPSTGDPQRQKSQTSGAYQPTPSALPASKPGDSPFSDNPALRDLYRQYSLQSGKNIERFGASLFRSDSGNVDKLTMDVPVGPDYVLGPGDTVILDVSGGDPQRVRVVVDSAGRLTLPGGGTLMVSGMTIENAEQAIERVLVRRFNNAKVDLSLDRVKTVRVYLVGEVERPGAYQLSALSTVLDGLIAAGGPNKRGSMRVIRHYRGDKLISTIDLYDLMLHGTQSDTQRLESGDSIMVPPVGAQVAVDGAIRRPAAYELRNELTLDQVLDLAGGLRPEASLWQISIDRVEANNKHLTRTVSVPPNADPEAIKLALSASTVHDGDRIYVFPISAYSEASVYLEGHAFRVGKYAFRQGMRVTDLIRSYSDLLPEPRAQAEIVRLTGPDLTPHAIQFNIVDVLDGKGIAPELRPFDVIRVFGRYEVDAPTVTIAGEVLRPGVYPMVAGMRASDLIRIAGGFRRSAYLGDALLASYEIQNGMSVEIAVKQVNLRQIAGGDKDADLLLKPGDRLSIRQIAGWIDIGAAVTLAGQVQFPGSYGIDPGERLSSVIRRAGGFLPEAYPQAVVFDRPEIKERSEETKLTIMRKVETMANPAISSGTSDGGVAPAQTFELQRKEILTSLRSLPTSGRMVINITPDLGEWENTSNDPEMRGGDSLTVPQRPGFVAITDGLNNTTALIYLPGKRVRDYLKQASGLTRLADMKYLYLIQAGGQVTGKESTPAFSSVKDAVVGPGDTIVVPLKILSESETWRDVLSTAQEISDLAVTAQAINFLNNPRIKSLKPDTGPVGTTVNISGSHFGDKPGAVKFGNLVATATKWSADLIVVTVPSKAPVGKTNVVVTVGGTSSLPATFTVEKP
jgi:protein involved in polysaccharide export with SLBB domain